MPLATYPLDIKITTHYLKDESVPQENYFLFDYHIKIHNKGDKVIQLLSRHWILTDGNGHKREVQGIGVVGQTPYIKPNGVFNYTSTTNFSTPIGSMYGKYHIQIEKGELVEVAIPLFQLVVPGILH